MTAWGFAPQERVGNDQPRALSEEILEKEPYEKGRPSEQEAFRYGDLRFIKVK